MSEVRKFFSILKVELHDMQDDLVTQIKAGEKKLAEGIYTEYVFKENLALYRCEIDALEDVIKEIGMRDPDKYATPEEAAADIRKMLPLKVHTWNYPELMIEAIERKMVKILGYEDIVCGH